MKINDTLTFFGVDCELLYSGGFYYWGGRWWGLVGDSRKDFDCKVDVSVLFRGTDMSLEVHTLAEIIRHAAEDTDDRQP